MSFQYKTPQSEVFLLVIRFNKNRKEARFYLLNAYFCLNIYIQ